MKTLILAAALCFALPAQDDSSWKKLDFLLGNWVGVAGEKDAAPGAGQGDFSFQPDLNRKIILRRNSASYDSGVQHDDLMVIYQENGLRAIYFDTEGHTIHYKIAFAGPDSVVFEGDPYRLSYRMEKGALYGKFEVGGKPYLQWTSRRK